MQAIGTCDESSSADRWNGDDATHAEGCQYHRNEHRKVDNSGDPRCDSIRWTLKSPRHLAQTSARDPDVEVRPRSPRSKSLQQVKLQD